MKHAFRLILMIAILAILLSPYSPSAIPAVQADLSYKEYFIVYSDNYDDGGGAQLFITSPKATYGTVEIPGIGWSTSFTIAADSITKILLPIAAEVQGSDLIQDTGIHIKANDTVMVYLLNPGEPVYTNDAYVALPVEALGTDYVILSWPDTLPARVPGQYGPSELAIVSPYQNVTVTITPSITTGTRAAGVPYNITLNQNQAYTLQNDTALEDLTGTLIHSSAPVAVFSGNRCVDIPATYGWCDHIIEQLLPVSAWGTSYVTFPTASRTNGDFLRILASRNNTTITVTGAAEAFTPAPPMQEAACLQNCGSAAYGPGGPSRPVTERSAALAATVTRTVNRGEALTVRITGPVEISSNYPTMVGQFGAGQAYGGLGDPLMMLVPPAAQFLNHYTFLVPTGYSVNYINVIAPTTSLSSITIDGQAVNTSQFTAIGTRGYSGASFQMTEGSHTIHGSGKFAIFVYGYGDYVSYGYPGGLGTTTINPPDPTPDLTPVIFIPGIGGTELENDQGKIWVSFDKLCQDANSRWPLGPTSSFMDVLRLDTTGTKPFNPNDAHYTSVKVSNVMLSATGTCNLSKLFKSVPIDENVYGNLINFLELKGYKRGEKLFLFGYDWRRDIAETTASLDALIESKRSGGKVNIIAHSMGGLVARQYILDQARAGKVDKLIILGTPFLGSLDAFETLSFGTDIDINKKVTRYSWGIPIIKLINVDKVKEISQNWPGMVELMPGRKFFEVYENGFIKEDTDKTGDGVASGELDYAKTKTFYTRYFNSGLITKAENFRSARFEGFDTQGAYNVKVYIFAGAGQETKVQIRYFRQLNTDTSFGIWVDEEHAEWIMGNGDSTVPLHSVDLKDDDSNLQGTAKVYYANAAHGDLPNDTNVQNQIIQLFGGVLTPVNDAISTDPNRWTVSGKTVKIYSPVELHIFDALGNHLGPSPDGGIEFGIPGATYNILGHDKRAFVPDGIDYSVVLKGNGSGSFDMVIQTVQADEIASSVVYKDIPTSNTLQAGVSLQAADGYLMSIDENGDGTPDRTVAPDAVLDPAASLDSTPPTTTIDLAGTQDAGGYTGTVNVTLTGVDETGGSGVLRILYSADNGHTFNVYSGAFTVDAGPTRVIIAKAIDRAGNEEYPAAIRWLRPSTTLLPAINR